MEQRVVRVMQMDILCSVVHPANLVMNNKAFFFHSLHLWFHVMKPHADVSLGVQVQRMRGLLCYVGENQSTITVLRNLWHQETFYSTAL